MDEWAEVLDVVLVVRVVLAVGDGMMVEEHSEVKALLISSLGTRRLLLVSCASLV